MLLLLVVTLLFHHHCAVGTENSVSNPLPSNFIDHTQDHVPVHKDKIVGLLLGNLNAWKDLDMCDSHEALKQLESVANEKFGSPAKAARFVRAVTEKLNATCDEINHLAVNLLNSPEHADKVRRAAEDAAVVGKPFFPGLLPFRFGGAAQQNPFFSIPMSAPALEMDLDRLMFIATPTLGINQAFQLARTLHLLHSPRSEVFTITEQFQTKNLTSDQATTLLHEYEQKLSTTTSPNSILENTAHLSGLNATEATRFARAISTTVGPLNSTQAMQIHDAIRDGGFNSSQLIGITKQVENLRETTTTTPDSATGHDWIFSGKRSLAVEVPKMFSSSRACGFAVNTKVGVVFPWMVTISCNLVVCSRTLVSTTTVITAADCVLACGNEPVIVLLGDARVVQPIEIPAQSAVVHPQYSQNNNPSTNIALIHLSKVVDFNEHPLINAICLLYTETDDPDIQCEVVMCNGAGHVPSEQPVSRSPVLCYQPETQQCSSNALRSNACVSLKSCFAIQTQKSSPVICNRRSNPARYYLWAVTTPDHAPTNCFNGVARISDSSLFIQNSL